MKMDNNQQDKGRIKRQMCGCSFLDLVIFELTAAIFTQNENFLKSRYSYHQFTQPCKFLFESINISIKYKFFNLPLIITDHHNNNNRPFCERNNPFDILFTPYYNCLSLIMQSIKLQ